MIQISGMWVNHTKDGEMYLSGYMGNAKLLLFKNKYSQDNENAPQWVLYVAPKENPQGESTVEDLE